MYALYYTVLYTGKLGFGERERERALGVIIASVPVLPPSPQCANNDFANFLPPFLWKIFCLPLFGEVGWIGQCNLGHVSEKGRFFVCLFLRGAPPPPPPLLFPEKGKRKRGGLDALHVAANGFPSDPHEKNAR